MPKIGEILIQMGAASAAHVKEGLENQVIFGGRLGTNLLELGHVDESKLAQALGQRYSLPFKSGEFGLDPAALALVGPDVIDRNEVIPFKVDGRKLALLVVDPNNLKTLDEVAFITGKVLQLTIVPEARMWVLMRSAYGIDRQLRGIDVDFARARGGTDGAAPKEKSALPSELMSQDAFDTLYAQHTPIPGTIPIAQLPPVAAKTANPTPTPTSTAKPTPTSTSTSTPAKPKPAVVAKPAVTAQPPAPPAATIIPDEELPTLELSDVEYLEPVPAMPAIPVAPPPPPPEPAPLLFAEAVKQLEGVEDRNAIGITVLRYARSRFKRAVLLTVQRSAANGWEGLGEGLTPQVVRRIRVKLGMPSAFETAISNRAHFLGPLQKTEANIRFLKALGGGAPKNAFIIPILALGRVVNVLYADNGRGASVDPELGELLILATKIAKSYDTLVSKAA